MKKLGKVGLVFACALQKRKGLWRVRSRLRELERLRRFKMQRIRS